VDVGITRREKLFRGVLGSSTGCASHDDWVVRARSVASKLSNDVIGFEAVEREELGADRMHGVELRRRSNIDNLNGLTLLL
jgi:hypothetical protein